MNLDRAVAAGAIALYGLAAVLVLPASEWARMLGLGAVVLAGVAAVARAMGDRRTPAGSILAVSFVGIAVLAAPGFPALGGRHLAAVPVGFLGSQAAALLWVSLRWSPVPRGPRTPLRSALAFGAFAAAALSAVATIPIVFAFFADRRAGSTLLLAYPGYFAGFLAAGLAYWLLQGIAHRPVGRYLIGVLGGLCVYGAVAPVVYLLDDDPIGVGEMVALALVLGCLVGPPVALDPGERSPGG